MAMRISFHEWSATTPARSVIAALGGDEVQVWLAAVPADEAYLTAMAGLLGPDERARAERFTAAGARRQYVLGRAVLRQLLGYCLDVGPETLEFGSTPRGKPFLTFPCGVLDLRFNLSHTRSLVAIALARGREVGADIERTDDVTDMSPLAARIFSPRDHLVWSGLPAAHRREAFFNAWTRKEAYLKATGEGLTDDLPAIRVTFVPGKEPEWVGLPGGPEDERKWLISGIPLPPDYAGAVVIEQDDLLA